MDSPDFLGSKFHSQMLANRIRAYWRKKDIEVNVWVEKEANVHVVRSNLQFSFPPAKQA